MKAIRYAAYLHYICQAKLQPLDFYLALKIC